MTVEFVEIDVDVERSFWGHTDLCYSVIHYPDLKKFVSCSWDGTIRLWNFLQNTNERLIHRGSEVAFQIFPFTETEFVGVFERGKVLVFSIERMGVVRALHSSKVEIYRVIKLDDDLLLVVSADGGLFLISYSKRKYKKILDPQSSFSLTFPIVSQSYLGCFYINLSASDGSKIKMIDYKENKVVKVFQDHTKEMHSMTVYKNVRNEEILVTGGKEYMIYIYNTFSMKCFKKIQFHDQIRKFFIFNQSKYLCCGDYYNGYFNLYDIKDDFRLIFNKKIHEDGITDFEILSIENSYPSSLLKLISCSFDKTLKITHIKNLPLEVDNCEMDLKERISYLFDDNFFDECVRCEESVLSIHLSHISLKNIFKTFLYSDN